MLLITRLSRFLDNVEFPAMRDEILASAIDFPVEEDLIAELADLPFDLYNSKEEIMSIILRKQASS